MLSGSGKDQEHHTMQQAASTTPPPKEESQLLTQGKKSAYPKSVFFIVGNEFCERFSYYGMRAILILYLTNWLKFGDDSATSIYHAFSVLCYFMPVFGAILADGYLGKYRTILYISLIYAAGNTVMTFTAFPPPNWIGPMFGLILIGLGTGGIKPCVSTFGGDQFASDQEKERVQFFSIFYFAINMGSLSSMLITPVVREYTQCFGSNCFPVAFGIPAILMLTAVALFFFGRRYYKILPPTGSVISRMACSIGHALKNKWNSSEKKDHWIYHADDKYEIAFLDDVKAVLHVFWLFLPLPMFWALFDQQGSRWTLQATQLNQHVVGNFYILPDQIQAVNGVLVLLLIPLFEIVIYPVLDKCKIPNRPLQRMVAGMLLVAGAFVLAGFLQLKIDMSLKEIHVDATSSKFGFVNMSPCSVSMSVESYDSSWLEYGQATDSVELPSQNYSVHVNAVNCTRGSASFSSVKSIQLLPQRAYFVYFYYDMIPRFSELVEYPLHKSHNGGPLVGISFINETSGVHYTQATFTQGNHIKRYDLNIAGPSSYVELLSGLATVSLTQDSVQSTQDGANQVLRAESGQVITVIITANDSDFSCIKVVHIKANEVTFWYQLPQYVILTCGEILFSITGISFAYSQAPDSMKSVVQAAWLLTTAFGDVIVIAVASVHLMAQAAEFFFFAALMALATTLYAIMSYFYKGARPTASNSSDLEQLTHAAEPIATESKEPIGFSS